jgi:hypothetical protein
MLGFLETATCEGSHMLFRIVHLRDEPHKAQTAGSSSALAGIQLRSMRHTSPWEKKRSAAAIVWAQAVLIRPEPGDQHQQHRAGKWKFVGSMSISRKR